MTLVPPSPPRQNIIGLGRFQVFLLIIAGLGFSADCMEVTLMSFMGHGVGIEWDIPIETCREGGREGGREVGGRAGGIQQSSVLLA
jgi:hypothetical protein